MHIKSIRNAVSSFLTKTEPTTSSDSSDELNSTPILPIEDDIFKETLESLNTTNQLVKYSATLPPFGKNNHLRISMYRGRDTFSFSLHITEFSAHQSSSETSIHTQLLDNGAYYQALQEEIWTYFNSQLQLEVCEYDSEEDYALFEDTLSVPPKQ